MNAPLSINLDPERDAERGAVSNCVLDWSRNGREKRKLEEAGMVLDQSQITDYFSVMNEIEHLLSENSRLASLLHCSTSNTGSEKSSCTGLSTSSFVAVLRHYFKCRTKCFSTSPRCETPRSGSKVCNILVRLYWTFSL